jgi:hypothetical protein
VSPARRAANGFRDRHARHEAFITRLESPFTPAHSPLLIILHAAGNAHPGMAGAPRSGPSEGVGKVIL